MKLPCRYLPVPAGVLAAALLAGAVPVAAQAPVSRPELRATRVERPPIIDGILGEDEWQQPPIPTDEWLSYNPLHGDRVPQQTTVWLSYDSDYLYFAFRCDDPDPNGIKTSVTRRDNIWQDDWIGLSLDALGSGQLSYHMLVNPSGVQLDALNSAAGNEDTAPDWIWDSAGRVTSGGYAVELRLPLQSIRFRAGSQARMGILFWRRVSRLGVSVSWPPLAPGVWVFERHAPVVFDNLQPRLAREVLPSATYSRTDVRNSPSEWKDEGGSDWGFGAKIGLTPTITLDATANPDFSQVESDAFQVEVNQRFPIFFGEKRPFFMEGAGIFALAGAGNGDNNLRTAVHTRRIIDPIFGAKLTGTAGRVAFGTLTAVDEVGTVNGSPTREGQRVFNIGRAQYTFGPSNYAGVIATDMTFDGGYNRVAGADLRWRVNDTQRFTFFGLASRSRSSPDSAARAGLAAQINYSYETQKWVVLGSGEHYDRDFEMTTAFMNRVGITSGWAFVDRSFYPDKNRFGWIRRAALFSFTQGGRDRPAGGNYLFESAGARFNFTRQGFLRVDRAQSFEHWQGQRFEGGRNRAFGNVQLYRWLFLDGWFSAGDAIYYVGSFQGRSREFRANVRLQPNGRLQQSIGYNRVAFDRKETGVRVFTVNIVNLRTTYQFTRAFAIRGITQYDSSRSRILVDLLSSYEPRPGTVVYAGYGSLIEQRDFQEGSWVSGMGDYETSRRGLFFKASYLYRF